MKKKILKIVITFAAVIFLVAASVVPSFAVTDGRDYYVFLYDHYEGLAGFEIRVQDGSQTTIYYNNPLYYGQISDNLARLQTPIQFEGDSLLYSNVVNDISENASYRGSYLFGDSVSTEPPTFDYFIGQITESFNPDPLAFPGSNSQVVFTVDSFIFDSKAFGNPNFIEFSGGGLAGVYSPGNSYLCDVTVSYSATSLLTGETKDFTFSREYNGLSYFDCINYEFMPSSLLGYNYPSIHVNDFDYCRIDNLSVVYDIREGTVLDSAQPLGIYNTLLAYKPLNGDTNYVDEFADVYYEAMQIYSIYIEGDSYQRGYRDGEEYGYNAGYYAGIEVNNPSFVTWLGSAVGGFLSVPLFGIFGIGGMLSVVVGIALLIAFLKFFAGG